MRPDRRSSRARTGNGAIPEPMVIDVDQEWSGYAALYPDSFPAAMAAPGADHNHREMREEVSRAPYHRPGTPHPTGDTTDPGESSEDEPGHSAPEGLLPLDPPPSSWGRNIRLQGDAKNSCSTPTESLVRQLAAGVAESAQRGQRLAQLMHQHDEDRAAVEGEEATPQPQHTYNTGPARPQPTVVQRAVQVTPLSQARAPARVSNPHFCFHFHHCTNITVQLPTERESGGEQDADPDQ